jgi:hypothetical protein
MYSNYNDNNALLANLLNKFGFNTLAKFVRTIHNGELLKEIVRIIEGEAHRAKDNETLEQLYFAGLRFDFIQGGK